MLITNVNDNQLMIYNKNVKWANYETVAAIYIV